MTTTRLRATLRVVALFVTMGASTSLAACGAGAGGASDGGRTAGVDPNWYKTVHSAAAKAKKAGELGSTPYLHADGDCAVADKVVLEGKKTGRAFAAGSATLGESGLEYVCEFHDPSITLSVVQFDDAKDLATAKESAHARQVTGNEQVDHTYRVGSRAFIVKRTSFPTNDTHVDYQAVYVDAKRRGVVVLQIETTGKQMKTYTGKQAARDLAQLLEKS